jgi:putative holliday junction resolvase
MRILGLDYGTKRVGVAISDELGLTAQGIATITVRNRRQLINEIESIVHIRGVETIVLGYPLRLDNSEGIQCEKVKAFARSLSACLAVPVILHDEALTTKEAEDILRNGGMRWRRRKEAVDKLAACLILQSYLDAQWRRNHVDAPHPLTPQEDVDLVHSP